MKQCLCHGDVPIPSSQTLQESIDILHNSAQKYITNYRELSDGGPNILWVKAWNLS